MFDIGWSELLLIGVVALIVVGPKDLPHLFHALGRFTAKARSMAREFSSAMEDAAKGSGIDEAAGSLRELKSLTSKKALGLDALDRAADRFEKWDPKVPGNTIKAQRDPAAPAVAPNAAPNLTPAPHAGATPVAPRMISGDAPSGTTPAVVAPPVAVPTGHAPSGDAQSDIPAPIPGQRRIRAVRRSDMKDL